MRIWFKSILLVLILGCAVYGNCAEQASPKPIKLHAEEFPLQDVKLLDSPFKTAMELNRKYLISLDADRLLHMFRVTAGLPSSAQPLGGWESPNCELRGHSMGHFLSGCSLTYASTGDKVLKGKVDYIVAELAKCQEAMPKQGYNKGYLSAYPESLFDRVDNSQPVWAPWYTYHKIFAGLLDAYTYCGNKQALDVLKKMSAWVKFRTDRLSEQKMQSSLNQEFGGIGESLANLYAITKNLDDLALARRFDKKWFTDPLAQGQDRLTGLHSNTHIPQVLASACIYELTGEKRYEDISDFFWKQLVDHRSFATGGTSNYEYWRSEPDKMASEISVESQESCCTYNMLKLTRKVFMWEPSAKAADYYERALYNGILPTIYPENGMTMYYVAMKPGHWKIFGTPTNSFWCCTGTGMENHAKYGDSIYFHDDKNLYVNLFIPSELNYAQKGLKVRILSEIPAGDTVSLAFTAKKPTDMGVKIRIPYWATNGVTVKINGQTQQVTAKPCSYLTLNRKWKNGDKIELKMPMSLHLAPMPDDENLTAVMYGPVVLAAELGTKDFTKDMQFAGDQRAMHGGPSIDVPCFVASGKPVDQWIKPVAGKSLTWRTVGVGKPNDVTLIPFYKLFDERYTIYMRLYSPDSYKAVEEARAAADRDRIEAEARTVDSVQIGSSESETKHDLKSENSVSGQFNSRVYRHADPSGWFSWTFKVLPDVPQVLRCAYWGRDNNRTFEILADGNKIGEQSLSGDKGDRFFNVDIKIPADIIRGKDKITVKFQGKGDSITGGVFGVAILKDK